MEQINQQLKDLRNQIAELRENQSSEEIISATGLMQWLEISRPTIHRWREKGIIKAYYLGKKIFFKRSEVLASLESENQINS